MILDACGAGELPDAENYGDSGANTLGNIARKRGGLNLPNLGKMGLGNIIDIKGVSQADQPGAYFGKMAEKSAGKDSTVGHWELAGLIMAIPFPVFPEGFPPKLVAKFEKLSGYEIIGNKAASGTKIIEELGDQHRETGKLIVYTSADSVFQIAAHKDTVPLEELYRVCKLAREMLVDEWGVSRVIARPFEGESGQYMRTSERKDFSIEPPSETVLDRLKADGHEVVSVGKVVDLFAGRGLTRSIKTDSNMNGVEGTLRAIREVDGGLIFVNLVDFDMLWGHRNDVDGFAQGLEDFDRRLPEITALLGDDDLLIITADHGCDPTLEYSTDHTREYVPLLVYNRKLNGMGTLGVRETFADVARTICQNFDLEEFPHGKGFLDGIS